MLDLFLQCLLPSLTMFSLADREEPSLHYLFNVNYGNTRTKSKICSKLTIETPERCQLRHSDVFTVNEQNSHIAPVFPFFTLNK